MLRRIGFDTHAIDAFFRQANFRAADIDLQADRQVAAFRAFGQVQVVRQRHSGAKVGLDLAPGIDVDLVAIGLAAQPLSARAQLLPSSGIGAALAQRFARAGFNLVLVARSEGTLKQQARALAAEHAIRAWVDPADLSQPGAARQLAVKMKRARRPIDVLVNCAGVLTHGSFIDIAATRHGELIDLNVSGLTDMLACFLPAMVERGSGRVLNVASIAAFQPVPMLATYAATKAYVLSLTESLAEELRGTGVSVTALCPGITATPMLSRAEQSSPTLARLPSFVIGGVDEVADEGFAACMRGDVLCVPGAINQAAVLAGRSTPKWLLRRVSGALARGLKR